MLSILGSFSLTSFMYEVHVDVKNKVVSTPAYMCNTDLHHIFDGMGALIKRVVELAKN